VAEQQRRQAQVLLDTARGWVEDASEEPTAQLQSLATLNRRLPDHTTPGGGTDNSHNGALQAVAPTAQTPLPTLPPSSSTQRGQPQPGVVDRASERRLWLGSMLRLIETSEAGCWRTTFEPVLDPFGEDVGKFATY
jgi:hypothetical protein